MQAERQKYLIGEGNFVSWMKYNKWQLTKSKDEQYKIQARPLATIEILEAYDWFELQKKELGFEFL